MKRIFKDNSGFTLVEVLVAVFFGLIVMAAEYSFFREQLFSLLTQEIKTATLQDARGALDIMIPELRNAGSWATGTAPAGCSRVVTATSTLIRVQADLDANGDCSSAAGEDVSYDLASATSTCPGSIIRRNGECLVANVVLPGALFTYYDSTNALLSGTPSVGDIKRVQIAFAVQTSNPNPRINGDITSTLSSSVGFRN